MIRKAKINDYKKESNMGQSPQSFEIEIRKTLRTDYLLYLPEQYGISSESWPLLLYLHGAAKRGDDLKILENQGLPMLISQEKQTYPFVIVSPQCPKDQWWAEELQMSMLDALLDDIISRYSIDANRIYVTGLSMGGFATWSLATAYPDKFAAIAPICGGGNPEEAHRIAELPTWVFHGAKDPTVPIEKSEEMVTALEKAGGNVKFTVYPDAGHDCWTETYRNPEIYKWFLKHSLRQESSVS
jgi:predicted peptidase